MDYILVAIISFITGVKVQPTLRRLYVRARFNYGKSKPRGAEEIRRRREANGYDSSSLRRWYQAEYGRSENLRDDQQRPVIVIK
jgi:hypothetical protein